MSAILVALQLTIAAQATGGAPVVAPSSHGSQTAAAVESEAPPPPGFLRFCVEFPDECGGEQGRVGYDRLMARPVLAPYWETVFSKPSASLRQPGSLFRRHSARLARQLEEEAAIKAEAEVAVSTQSDMRAIEAINRDVNWRIKPRTDNEAFGVADYWTLPLAYGAKGVGDCEDFVLQKRSTLRKSGYSLKMMSIALVEVPGQQTHAVLLLNTDRGVMVLDNLDSRVRRLSRSPYRVISREQFGAPLHWKAGAGSEADAL